MLGGIGRKQAQIAASFMSSAAGFGATAVIGIVYFTDWKVIAANIPFYGGKFKDIKTE